MSAMSFAKEDVVELWDAEKGSERDAIVIMTSFLANQPRMVW